MDAYVPSSFPYYALRQPLTDLSDPVELLQVHSEIAQHEGAWLQALGVSASWEGMGIQIGVAAAAVISTLALAMKRPALDGAAAK